MSMIKKYLKKDIYCQRKTENYSGSEINIVVLQWNIIK